MRKYARRDGKQLGVVTFVFVLLAVATFSALFFVNVQGASETLKSTENITVAYNETFESCTVGQLPSNSWYTLDAPYGGFGSIAVANTTVFDGSKSLYFPEPSGQQSIQFNLTSPSDYTYVAFWEYLATGDTLQGLRLFGLNDSGAPVNIFNAEMPSKYNSGVSEGFAAHYNGSWHDLVDANGNTLTGVYGKWVHIEFIINYSSQQITMIYNGVTAQAIPFQSSAVSFQAIYWGSNNNYQSVWYIDDLTIGNVTDTNPAPAPETNTISWSNGMTMPSSDPQGLGFDGKYWYEGTGSTSVYVVDTSGNTVKTLTFSYDHVIGLKTIFGNTLIGVDWNGGHFTFVNKTTWQTEATVSTDWAPGYSVGEAITEYTNTTNVIFAQKWKDNTSWFDTTIYAVQIFHNYTYKVLKSWSINLTSYEGDGLDPIGQGIAWDAQRGILWHITGWYDKGNAKLWALRLNDNGTITVLHVWDVSGYFSGTEPQGLVISPDCNTLYTMKTGSATLMKIDISQVNLTGNWNLGIQTLPDNSTSNSGENNTNGGNGTNENGTGNDTNNNTNNSTGGGGGFENITGGSSFLLKTIEIAGYKVPVWVLIAAAVLLIFFVASVRRY